MTMEVSDAVEAVHFSQRDVHACGTLSLGECKQLLGRAALQQTPHKRRTLAVEGGPLNGGRILSQVEKLRQRNKFASLRDGLEISCMS